MESAEMGLGMLVLTAIGLGWSATALVRMISHRLDILDHPNERSSHVAPTPTLGGVGLIVGVWLALGIGRMFGMPMPVFWPEFLVGSLILIVLVYDEVRPMGRLAKLAVQVGAGLALMGAGTVLKQIVLPGVGEVHLGWLAYPVTVLWLVGLQNLYNFMDGLDRLAGLEGVLVAGLWGGLALNLAPEMASFGLALSGAALGFFLWNRSPARVFMGDVGAHFLGLSFALLAVLGSGKGIPFIVMVILLGAFLFDSVYTLVRRLLRGENITLGHRFHLYQRLYALGWSAWRIALLFGCFTLALGWVGYLWIENNMPMAYGVGGVTIGLMALGAVWVEWMWAHRPGRK